LKSVEVLRANAGAIEIEGRIVDDLAESADVTDRHIKAARAGVAADAGERVGEVRVGSMVVEAEIQGVGRGALSALCSLAEGAAGAAEGVVQANVQVVAAVLGGSDEVEILRRRVEVGRGNKCKKALRNRVDGQAGILKIIAGYGRSRVRIDELGRYGGKVSAA